MLFQLERNYGYVVNKKSFREYEISSKRREFFVGERNYLLPKVNENAMKSVLR
jgi:hypothetical protein